MHGLWRCGGCFEPLQYFATAVRCAAFELLRRDPDGRPSPLYIPPAAAIPPPSHRTTAPPATDDKHAPPPLPPPRPLSSMACSCAHGVEFDANVIRNSALEDGLAGWAAVGACTELSVRHEESARVPTETINDVEDGYRPSGRYILAAGRGGEEDGLCQAIPAGALKPRVTYRVAGWIGLGDGAAGEHAVRVNIRLDGGEGGECAMVVEGGAVCAEAGRWTEIKGVFRLKAIPPSGAAVHVQGAPPGVDVKVMDLQVFATDRKARFKKLRKKTDKVRRRDVVLKFAGAGASSAVSGASIRVMQMDTSFAFGACINPAVIQEPAFVDYFTKHFDWAVFENELKWYHTEAVQGQLNYADPDALLDFCDRHGKPVRGHCIFWAVDRMVQKWVKDLPNDQLAAAVQGRLTSLLTRYAGRFPHYDVNNEMLHGTFFQDRLGDDINAFMFKETARIDPGAALFVNDYNVEGGSDPSATPDKYIAQVNALMEKGAPVGGIGLQGHVTNPAGEIICDALDKLATTDLPVWLTELDVCESDVCLRAEDLEVVLREAYAHPAVEGVVLWGFMQGHMWRQDACLVNADGTINDAGQRFINLRQEWTSHARGKIDSDGNFKFRGYHGSYVVQLATATGKMHKAFSVDKGDTPLVLDMDV
ncbi:endo-1,4-beta-xylanase 1-like [Hordeum vulgare subsp. vulgare]|uniref:GH10 domain-containing protein n=1 Tax=Hordeum vulgare subsp. vulgare TaxID=112509 RepID=A0A8I6XP76_HORVV|nr:endo-1,4-beta-xylanase 1-like [Hordeum vulgare subsp. vulgare]